MNGENTSASQNMFNRGRNACRETYRLSSFSSCTIALDEVSLAEEGLFHEEGALKCFSCHKSIDINSHAGFQHNASCLMQSGQDLTNIPKEKRLHAEEYVNELLMEKDSYIAELTCQLQQSRKDYDNIETKLRNLKIEHNEQDRTQSELIEQILNEGHEIQRKLLRCQDEKSSLIEEKNILSDQIRVLQQYIYRHIENQTEGTTCVVCLDREVDITFVPCGHVICCEPCTAQLRSCPICRTPVRRCQKRYVSSV